MLIYLLSIVCFVLAAWLATFRRGRRRLYELADKLPGSQGLPLLGHLHRFTGNHVEVMTAIKEESYLANRQGGLTKLWVGPFLFVLITDPSDIEFVLKNCLEKGEKFSEPVRKYVANGISVISVPEWRKRRRALAPAFGQKNLDVLPERFSESGRDLVRIFRDNVNGGEFDVWSYFASFTMQNFTQLGMGGPKQSWSDSGRLIEAISRLLIVMSKCIFRPWLQIDFIFKLSPIYATHKQDVDYVYGYLDNLIHKYKTESNDSKNENEWREFIRIWLNNNVCSFTDQELREEALVLAVGAIDTSANALSYAVMLLGQHQDVQEKVYQEIMSVVGNSDKPFSKEHLDKLQYLERVLLESMRLYPTVPLIAREVTEEEVTLPSGHVLPVGCGVFVSIWGVHRDPKYWGDNAEEFDPEHFSEEKVRDRPACAYIPFSHGPRNCIGYKYAMLGMKVALAAVLREYRMVSEHSGPITVKYDMMLRAANGYKIVLKERKR